MYFLIDIISSTRIFAEVLGSESTGKPTMDSAVHLKFKKAMLIVCLALAHCDNIVAIILAAMSPLDFSKMV